VKTKVDTDKHRVQWSTTWHRKWLSPVDWRPNGRGQM